MGKPSRSKTHEIDTHARRIVPFLLPREWEHREPGGRDYGIDMQIELFTEGNATGQTLLLQIKGTEKHVEPKCGMIPFDLETQTLKYSELFSVPFLLIFCPVREKPEVSYFLWLQEYVSVVLDFEKPNWRQNTSTTRVHIPIGNKIPGCEKKMERIAGEPSRTKGWGIFAHVHHELEWALVQLDVINELNEDISRAVDNAKAILAKLSNSPLIRDDWHGRDFVKHQIIEPFEMMLPLVARSTKITFQELSMIPNVKFTLRPEQQLDSQLLFRLLINHLRAQLQSMKAYMSQQFDVGYRYSMFQYNREHLF